MATSSGYDIQSAAENAIRVAKKELDKTLDYSVGSLKDLDSLINHVRKNFLVLRRDGKLAEQTIQRATISIGSYLGETIRRIYGGDWVAKNSIAKVLVIHGIELSPMNYVFQRLVKDLDYPLENYLIDIADKLQSRNNIQDKNKVLGNKKKDIPASKRSGRLWLLFGGGIATIMILCVIGFLGVAVYTNIEMNKEFKIKLNAYLTDADKLNIMTKQGVTYQEFRTQLIEVKLAYEAIDSWPRSYQDEKHSFDLAMQGWDLILKVWDFNVGNSLSYYPDDVSRYLGTDVTYAGPDEHIRLLMSKASSYYEMGKIGIK